jgi:sensor histidine kinase regulating citrate/malate metabolism
MGGRPLSAVLLGTSAPTLAYTLVHSLLTALGGTISVESRVNQGTVFRVSLPAAPTPH